MLNPGNHLSAYESLEMNLTNNYLGEVSCGCDHGASKTIFFLKIEIGIRYTPRTYKNNTILFVSEH